MWLNPFGIQDKDLLELKESMIIFKLFEKWIFTATDGIAETIIT